MWVWRYSRSLRNSYPSEACVSVRCVCFQPSCWARACSSAVWSECCRKTFFRLYTCKDRGPRGGWPRRLVKEDWSLGIGHRSLRGPRSLSEDRLREGLALLGRLMLLPATARGIWDGPGGSVLRGPDTSDTDCPPSALRSGSLNPTPPLLQALSSQGRLCWSAADVRAGLRSLVRLLLGMLLFWPVGRLGWIACWNKSWESERKWSHLICWHCDKDSLAV